MPFYVKQGEVPDKRHIALRDDHGHLLHEELVSRNGFSDTYSNAYHLRPPTRVRAMGAFKPLQLVEKQDPTHRHHHLRTTNFSPRGNWIFDRNYLFFNADCVVSVCHPAENTELFYRNGHADEVLFVQEGSGRALSQFGELPLRQGDYLVVPGGTMLSLQFERFPVRLFVVEANGIVEPPRRYRNRHGQFMEHAPFCERDITAPSLVDPVDDQADFEAVIKTRSGWQALTLAHHPFDCVGWDGFYFPYTFNIRDFMPIVGKVHQPPPVHQTFEGPGFVICSFCPRLFDFHEQAIPAPYNHSNVDSDELLYYVEGEFMSRRGISPGSITLHPSGLPHGPQPGLYEASIGKRETQEFAVMFDTFAPLKITETAMAVDDETYPYSWLE